MLFAAFATIAATLAIDPKLIDHQVARGLAHHEGSEAPSGFSVLASSKGLILLSLVLMIFHFGNAPISRLIAQAFSIQLGTPFRTTAITTGVSQLSMIGMALMAPWLIRRFGLATVFIVALAALPIRGAIAGIFPSFAFVFPVQFLDGVGAGLIGIATPIAAERILSGTGRFNVGLAAVMTVQGIGASLSNVVAGWLTDFGGYGLAYWVHGCVALALFVLGRHDIAPRLAESQTNPSIRRALPGRCGRAEGYRLESQADRDPVDEARIGQKRHRPPIGSARVWPCLCRHLEDISRHVARGIHATVALYRAG